MSRCVPVLTILFLSGCVAPFSSGLFPDHSEAASATNPKYPGIRVEGTVEGTGSELRADAMARNAGTRTYRIISPTCGQPWGETMTGPSGNVDPHEPMVRCSAFILAEFRPGDQEPFNLAWNGTLWEHGTHRFVRAPQGSYAWRLSFEVFRNGGGGEGGERDYFQLDFPVKVR